MTFNQNKFGIHRPHHKFTLLVADLLFLSICFAFASFIRLKQAPNLISIEFLGISTIVIFCLFVGGAYTSTKIGRSPKLPLNTFFVVLASTIPTLLFIYILGPSHFTSLLGRGVYPVAILFFGLISVFTRLATNFLFHSKKTSDKIVVLGPNSLSDTLMSALENSNHPYHYVHQSSINEDSFSFNHLGAIVVMPEHSPSEEEQNCLLKLRLTGLPIFSLSDFCESTLFIVPVQEVNNDWFIRAQGFTMLHSNVAVRIKRFADVSLSLLLLILASPLMLLTALLIKLTSSGPIIFTQTRVGMNGNLFNIHKFRTMENNAESGGATWAAHNDPRITVLGKFLRRTRIDELPQCWNILIGEMSLIGPRPERPEFTEDLSKQIPYYDLRHIVKPGLTGWAQVCYPYGASVDDSLKKLQYDLYYIKNYSLLLDLNILLRTVLITIQQRGR